MTTHTVESYVLFELAGSVYGIPSREVRHVEMLEHVTLVPNGNPVVEGVVFSRGEVFPALNLRLRFGLPRVERTLRTRVIFTAVHGRTVGLIVDSAREFRGIPADSIRPMEKTLTGIRSGLLKAVAKVGDRLVLILDLEAILKVDEVELPAGESTPRAQDSVS